MDAAPSCLRSSASDKRFGGLSVLTGVSFDVAQGRSLGLIGPNGAGKTTLFNILSGLVSPTPVPFFSTPKISPLSNPNDARCLGSRVLFKSSSLSVVCLSWKMLWSAHSRSREGPSARQRAIDALERVGLIWPVRGSPRP